jgi:hypothetical protein
MSLVTFMRGGDTEGVSYKRGGMIAQGLRCAPDDERNARASAGFAHSRLLAPTRVTLHRPALAVGGVGLATLVWLVLTFTRWTASSGWSFPWFVIVAVALVYLPGRLVRIALGLDGSRLEAASLALALGIPVAAVSGFLAVYAGRPRLVWLLPAAAILLTLHPRCRFRAKDGAPWRPRYAHAALAAVFVTTLVPCVTSPFYFQNLARTDDGRLSTYLLADVVSHVSMAAELTHTVPPQNPFLPDRRLVYHYGMHVLAAAFAAFGLSVADLMTRFLAVFFMGLTVLGTFVLARRWLRSEGWAVFAAFLVVFGEDFSFLGAAHADLSQTWASYFFGIPTVISLYMINPMLPALGVLMIALLCLERYFDTQEARWLAAALLLAPVLATSKVFVAIHLLAGLGLTAAVYALVYRRWAALVAAATSGLVVAACVWAMSSGYRGLDAELHPWPYVTDAIVRLGLRWTWIGQQALAFQRGEYRLLPVATFVGLALPGYLLLTFGARSLGLAAWFRALVRPTRDGAFRFLLASLVVIGVLFTMLVTATAAGYPRRAFGNNTVWFFVQSKYLMWLFALEPVRRLRGGRAAAAAGLLIALSVPSAIHFHVLQAQEHPTPLERPLAEVVDFLARAVRPGESCFAREGPAQAILVATRCHALALDVFPSSYLRPAALEAVRRERDEFWRRWREEPGRLPDETLATWRVDYVVAETSRDGTPASPPTGRAFRLEPRFANADYAVYRVVRDQNWK